MPARPSLTAIFRTLTDGANGRLLLYLMAAQAAVQISGPYFNPYMLGELQFSYSTYVIVVCAAIVAKILFLPTVGRIADRMGVRRVFWISAAAIVPSSALWLVSNNCGYLIAIQIYSGMAWCAFDLATLLLFFETIPRQKRVDVLAFFNLANSAATAGGSLLGAGILAALGANRPAYLVLFALSTIARAAAIVLLARIPGTCGGWRGRSRDPCAALSSPRAGAACGSARRRHAASGKTWSAVCDRRVGRSESQQDQVRAGILTPRAVRAKRED